MENASPYVLTISGSDSSGGAGMQADNRAILRAGGFPLNVVTALTLQTPQGVEGVEFVQPAVVERQMRALLSAYPVGAIKLGMLATGETVHRVARVLRNFPDVPSVLDPVFCSTSGRVLLDRDGVEAVRDQLMPIVRLTTPNLDELAELLGRKKAGDRSDVLTDGAEMVRRVGSAVLVKGGHGGGDVCEDILFNCGGGCSTFSAPRVASANTRGTGCALSASIAARLACGDSMMDAVGSGKSAIAQSLVAQATRTWVGSGPAFL